jgi:alanine dehydrogenase
VQYWAPRITQNILFVNICEQASHGGELAHAVQAGLVGPADVGRIGGVLSGDEPGRRSAEEITTFDSTGLAIQDLAIAIAALEGSDALDDLPRVEL